MAKLHNYHILCPLIDQKSFLGVSQDQDEENVLVTLGRNVVNKYRLSDQKQIGGWTSRDHITSNIIFDKEQESYVGVFNKNTIKMWKEDSENLDKAKKYKFPGNILKLILTGDQSSLIIFANGNCASLSYALENRKSFDGKSLIKDPETIIDAICYTIKKVNHICYIVKNCKNVYEIIYCPLREELGDLEKSKLNKIKVTRSEETYVVGSLISVDSLSVYILWNDSKLASYELTQKCWKNIGFVSYISTLRSVSLAWMGKDHIILFGSNIEQDGAIIIAYNIVLGVVSYRYPMKMYTENAKLYCYSNKIILEASNHVGMLPYVLELNRNLSNLLGSQDSQNEEMEVAKWDADDGLKLNVNREITELLKLGLTERNICAQLIPPLLEKDDHKKILQYLKQFQDVPESVLVSLLSYTVKLVNGRDIDLSDSEAFRSAVSTEVKSKFDLLHHIFQIPFSDALLIPILRNNFSLEDTLFLLTYIADMLIDPELEIKQDFESKLIDWCILLMDAFYQQYLMTKDEKVTIVLQRILSVVAAILNSFDEIDKLIPLMNKVLIGRKTEEKDDSMSYSIELMQI